MNATQHTPGKWVVFGSAKAPGICVEDRLGTVLVEAATDDDDDIMVGIGGYSIEERAANAHVMRAGPDMLEALREIELLALDVADRRSEICELALAAIAKAAAP